MRRLVALTVIAIAGWSQPHLARCVEAGTNSISHLEVMQPNPEGWAHVEFDYFYTGEPQGAVFHIDLAFVPGSKLSEVHGPKLDLLPEPGAHHFKTNYQYESNANVAPAGNYNIAVSYGPFCMTAASASNGTAVNLQPCNGSAGQSWQVAAASNGNYVLHPANNPALCLDVRNNGNTAGTVVIGWDCNGGSNESWAIQ